MAQVGGDYVLEAAEMDWGHLGICSPVEFLAPRKNSFTYVFIYLYVKNIYYNVLSMLCTLFVNNLILYIQHAFQCLYRYLRFKTC